MDSNIQESYSKISIKGSSSIQESYSRISRMVQVFKKFTLGFL